MSLKSVYIDTPKSINTQTLRVGILKREFDLSSPAIVAFVNEHDIPTLSFVFQTRCSAESLMLYAHCLHTIMLNAHPHKLNLTGMTLNMANIPLSFFSHYTTATTGIFSSNIIIRKKTQAMYVAHLKIPPKDFAIPILNMFQHTYKTIQQYAQKTASLS